MLKFGRAVHICSRVSRFGPERLFNASKPQLHVQIRCLSAGDIFGKVDSTKLPNLPDLPLPLPDKISVQELAASGQSVLQELGIFSWFTPSSYLRWGLESLHLYADIPWWGSIAIVSFTLRLLTIYVPIMAQRNTAIQSKYKKELREFTDRMNDARAEGDNMQVQQVLIEQQKFMKSKGISIMSQAGIMLVNASVFLANFLAIKKMTAVDFPGFETGGTLWFTNLLETDPYLALPAIAAASTFVSLKLGIDTGASSDQMTPGMRLFMQYGFPSLVLVSGWFFPSALAVHWVTSNTFSLITAGLFRIDGVRKILNIPPIIKHDKSLDKNAVREIWQSRKATKSAPPSLASLRKSDYDNFKKAGTGKPTAI